MLLLTCAIIRYRPVLKRVIETHIELFSKSVEDRIMSECGGVCWLCALQSARTRFLNENISYGRNYRETS